MVSNNTSKSLIVYNADYNRLVLARKLLRVAILATLMTTVVIVVSRFTPSRQAQASIIDSHIIAKTKQGLFRCSKTPQASALVVRKLYCVKIGGA